MRRLSIILSPYSGFRFNSLKIRILSFQSRTNPLRLSSLKVRVRGSAFSTDECLVLNPLVRYSYMLFAYYFVGFGGTLITEKNIENILRMRNRQKKNDGK